MITINQFHHARVLILLNLIVLGSCCDKIQRTCTSSAPSSEENAGFIEPKNIKGFDQQWLKYQQSNDFLSDAQALLGNGITANTLSDWDKAYLSEQHFDTLTHEGFFEPNVDVITNMEVPDVPPSESKIVLRITGAINIMIFGRTRRKSILGIWIKHTHN